MLSSRQEFATRLVNMLRLEGDVNSNFYDVQEKEWYYQLVGLGRINGLSVGTIKGNFRPTENITREDMALTVIQRTM